MRILVTGGNGMLGQALLRCAGRHAGLTVIAPPRRQYDLLDRAAADRMFRDNPADAVIHAAARVGGIQANVEHPYAFLTENLLLNANVIEAARRGAVRNFLYVGSSCMYPRDYVNPLKEEYLLAAPLEPTNEGYAIAKIAGAKACEYLAQSERLNYRTIIPSNLYGPGDSFAPDRSHLVASVIAKTMRAVADGDNSIEIWGDGTARREFLYVDDLADLMLDMTKRLDTMPQYLNVGANEDLSIRDYYETAATVLGFKGSFTYDLSRPSGMNRKLLDSSRAAALGWAPRTTLAEGIARTAAYYREHQNAPATSH